MQGVSGLKIVGTEGKVKLLFAEVIFLRVILQPGELQLKFGLRIGQIDDDIVVACLAACLLQTQSFLVKPHRALEVRDVVVFVDHFEFHGDSSFSLGMVRAITLPRRSTMGNMSRLRKIS